ncbi:MAG: hypothetical protein ABIP82_06970, partial [Nitrospirales bacterium]
ALDAFSPDRSEEVHCPPPAATIALNRLIQLEGAGWALNSLLETKGVVFPLPSPQLIEFT